MLIAEVQVRPTAVRHRWRDCCRARKAYGVEGNAGADRRSARKADGGAGTSGGTVAMLVRPTAVMAALVVIAEVLVRPPAVMAPLVGSPHCPQGLQRCWQH